MARNTSDERLQTPAPAPAPPPEVAEAETGSRVIRWSLGTAPVLPGDGPQAGDPLDLLPYICPRVTPHVALHHCTECNNLQFRMVRVGDFDTMYDQPTASLPMGRTHAWRGAQEAQKGVLSNRQANHAGEPYCPLIQTEPTSMLEACRCGECESEGGTLSMLPAAKEASIVAGAGKTAGVDTDRTFRESAIRALGAEYARITQILASPNAPGPTTVVQTTKYRPCKRLDSIASSHINRIRRGGDPLWEKTPGEEKKRAWKGLLQDYRSHWYPPESVLTDDNKLRPCAIGVVGSPFARRASVLRGFPREHPGMNCPVCDDTMGT
jgi:hypothetical protein